MPSRTKDNEHLYKAAASWGGEAYYIARSVWGKGNQQQTVQMRGLLTRLYGGRVPRPVCPATVWSDCRSRLTELVWLYQDVLDEEPSLWRQVAKDLVLIRLVMDLVDQADHIKNARKSNNILTRLNNTIERLAVRELM